MNDKKYVLFPPYQKWEREDAEKQLKNIYEARKKLEAKPITFKNKKEDILTIREGNKIKGRIHKKDIEEYAINKAKIGKEVIITSKEVIIWD